jgi:hypothetical protein
MKEKTTAIEQAEAIADRIFFLERERLLLWKEISRCEHRESVFNDEIDELRKKKEGFEDLKLPVTDLEKQIQVQEQFKAPYSREARLFKIRVGEIDKELVAIKEVESMV